VQGLEDAISRRLPSFNGAVLNGGESSVGEYPPNSWRQVRIDGLPSAAAGVDIIKEALQEIRRGDLDIVPLEQDLRAGPG
jgi:hypothetical protein